MNSADWQYHLAMARAYADAGLRIFPCHVPIRSAEGPGCSCPLKTRCKNPGKHPRVTGWQHVATIDHGVIETWGWEYLNWNIGIATGIESGIVVVDIDPRHGGDETLAALETEHGPLPPTWRFLTGSLGEHILFQHPGGYIGNTSGPDSAIGPGIDFRGDGGLIIAPPSRHISGRCYEVSVDHHPEDVDLAAMPGWLLSLVRGIAPVKSAPRKASGAVGSIRPHGKMQINWDDFARNTLAEGNRHTGLVKLAGKLWWHFPSQPVLVAQLLLAWNAARCQPPQSVEEAVKIIVGIGTRHAKDNAAVLPVDWPVVIPAPRGERHPALIGVATALWQKLSRHPELVAQLITAWNMRWCAPPIPEPDVARVIQHTTAYQV